MDDKQTNVETFRKEPELPNIYWLGGSAIAIGIALIINIHSQETIIGIIFLVFIVSLLIAIHFGYRCNQNKTELYVAYQKSQIAYNESQKTLKTQIALREKAESEKDSITEEKFKAAIQQLYLQQIPQDERKDDQNGKKDF